MRRWRLIAATAAFVALVVSALVGVAFLMVALSKPVPVVQPPDPCENARREGRPQFGPDESKPITNTHIGKTREELIGELGQPTREGPWPIGSPPLEWWEKHKGLSTLEWHWESGQFWASVYPENGRWACIQSIWVPTGVIVD